MSAMTEPVGWQASGTSSGARSLDELLLVLISEGTSVSTPDGPYGSIRELIVNPYDNLATHVVIQPTTGGPGRLVAVDRLTPTPAAVFVDLDEIGFSECASVDVHGCFAEHDAHDGSPSRDLHAFQPIDSVERKPLALERGARVATADGDDVGQILGVITDHGTTAALVVGDVSEQGISLREIGLDRVASLSPGRVVLRVNHL